MDISVNACILFIVRYYRNLILSKKQQTFIVSLDCVKVPLQYINNIICFFRSTTVFFFVMRKVALLPFIFLTPNGHWHKNW